MQKQVITGIIIAIIFGGAGYYVGTKTASATNQRGNTTTGNFARGTGMRGAGAGAGAGGFTTGQVISKDATSLTVSLPAGGSKVVLYDNNTTVSKTDAGTIDDVQPNSQVVITGTPNADGSLTATNIQLRPATTTRAFNPAGN